MGLQMTSKEFDYPALLYNCKYCGEEFRVACLSELKEKRKKHVCAKVNKRVERTMQLQQAQTGQFVRDVVADRIHQYNFDQLVSTGVIVSEV